MGTKWEMENGEIIRKRASRSRGRGAGIGIG